MAGSSEAARRRLIAAIALGCFVAVDLFQLTGIPLVLGGAFLPAMLMLGTVFDARDLLVYAVTVVVVVCAADAAIRRVAGRRGKLDPGR